MAVVGPILEFLNKHYPRKASKPELTEVAPKSKSLQALNWFVGNIMVNPDPVLSSSHAAGKGLRFYQDMEDKDTQVASCLRTRKKSVTNKAWSIVPATERLKDQKIVDFVQEAFQFPGFDEARYEMLDCIAKGFSMTEIMWIYRDGNYFIEDLKARDQSRFIFDKDSKPLLRTQASPWTGEELPEKKFIYMRNEPFAENPYGNPVLKEVFWYYWFKKTTVKWLMIFLERFGTPLLLANYETTLGPEAKEALQTAIDTVSTATAMRAPKGIELKFLEAARRGEAGYLSFIEYCDQQIAKAIHGQTLTSGEGRRVGSMALGKVHEETREEYIADDCRLLMGAFNHQLIPWLVDFNFAAVTQYPRFVIHFEPEEDLSERAKRDEILVTRIGVPVSPDYFYDTYDLPKPAEDEQVVEPPKRGPMFAAFAARGRGKFPYQIKGWTIGSTAKIQDKYRTIIQKLLMSMQPEYVALIEQNRPLRIALEELIGRKFRTQLEGELTQAISQSIVHGAQSMADQLKLTISKDTFTRLMDSYMKRRAYEKGTIAEIGTTLRDLLSGKAQALLDQQLSVEEVARQIKASFPELADWKARQIAKTEVNTAADYAGTQMVKESGIPVDAHFLVDPASCDQCQEWATRNPYTIADAEAMGLPHPNCDDQWVFTVKK